MAKDQSFTYNEALKVYVPQFYLVNGALGFMRAKTKNSDSLEGQKGCL